MNDDDPVIKEIEETDRRLWEEGGGTVHGFFELCERIAKQAREEYALYGDRWRGVGWEPAKPAGRRRRLTQRRRETEAQRVSGLRWARARWQCARGRGRSMAGKEKGDAEHPAQG